MSAFFILIWTAVAFLRPCSSLLTHDCPEGWFSHRDYCYMFEGDNRQTYDEARARCGYHGASVLSVEDMDENAFIVQWLQVYDQLHREWYTSGVTDTSQDISETATVLLWESTGEAVDSQLTSLFLESADLDMSDGVIIYSFDGVAPGWLLVDRSEKRAYICKIHQREVYRILVKHRDFDYGAPEGRREGPERGPRFIIQPQSVVTVRDQDTAHTRPVILECVVHANPPATYTWYKGTFPQTEITESLDTRYIIINGKLTIEKPSEAKDADVYQCTAHNKFGTVISDIVEVSFGNLGEFSNVPDAGSRAEAFDGAALECSRIQYKPGISYQWIKGADQQFVRTEFQHYKFISNNGKLYFSEVSSSDEDDYSCLATLTGVSTSTLGTHQPPMRTSLPIPLFVDDQAPKADWGPEIQNDFIAVFPKTPLKGQDVRLECFAYGSFHSSQFLYSWSRDDQVLPKSAEMFDHNRVLVIRDVQLEDSGIYRCTVIRVSQASDTKTLQLSIEAKPYLINHLEDQHVDIDSQITWVCNARGKPDPIYHWYKDGEKLASQPEHFYKVHRNVLTITNLNPALHNGMYQCGAENSHGVTFSNAQLRVLDFAPTFSKSPPPSRLLATQEGNVTLSCQPEGAPLPDVQWLKNGSPIHTDGSKYTVLVSGHLHMTSLSLADRGVYTCKATNVYGEAQASTVVEITQGVTITLPPSDTWSTVNNTVFFTCEASCPPGLDLVYEWMFNSFPVDFDSGSFRQVQGSQPGTNGLYIINVGFDHEGEYTCVARSTFSAEYKSAYLSIKGTPGPPAGVYTLSDNVTHNSTVVVWTSGSSHGGTVTSHVIQAANEFDPTLWIDLILVAVADSGNLDGSAQEKHSCLVTGLNPGTGYTFRVKAQNEYGSGAPSDPSPYIQILSAAPSVCPRHLRGGGGSVGDLTIRWDPLQRSEFGARSVSYNVYWRRKVQNPLRGGLFQEITVTDSHTDHLVIQVGAESFFLLYEVMIHAFNQMGHGPNSTVVDVYSAEDLPIAVPHNVKASTYNSTAIEVYWDPVPDTRMYMKGKIVGYQLNYWQEDEDPDVYMRSVRHYGQLDYALVIGLVENLNWVVDIQVYNSAGLGPRSNKYIMETSGYAPLTYPQEVHITSAGHNRARLWWRGVTLTVNEEALLGYAIWLWTASEGFRTAQLIEVAGRVTTYVLKDIKPNRLYAMRISAVGGGGYGKKTPPLYFTTEGEVLIDHSLADMVSAFNSAGICVCSYFPVVYCVILCFLFCVY